VDISRLMGSWRRGGTAVRRRRLAELAAGEDRRIPVFARTGLFFVSAVPGDQAMQSTAIARPNKRAGGRRALSATRGVADSGAFDAVFWYSPAIAHVFGIEQARSTGTF